MSTAQKPAAEEQRDEVSRVFRAPMFRYQQRRRIGVDVGAELFACAAWMRSAANSLYRIIPPARAIRAEELVILQ